MTNAVHVWRCLLDRDFASPGVLDQSERDRAAAFAFPHLRRRFVTAHAFLRSVIASCIGMEPAAVDFAYSATGKPCLRGPQQLPFNLSHAGDVAYLAVAETGEIGIDVELDHPVEDAIEVGRTVFSAEELRMLSTGSEADLSTSFLRCWTRKEAYVKALGLGIGLVDLRRITVGVLPVSHVVPALPGISASSVHVRSLEIGFPEQVAVATTEPLSAMTLHDFASLDA